MQARIARSSVRLQHFLDVAERSCNGKSMPWSRETALRLAVADYQKGARIALLASKYRVNYQAIHLALKKSGVPLRPLGADHRKPVDARAIVKSYLDGDSVLSVAIAHGVSRPVVERRLKEARVKKRTASEQSYISAARQSPEERLERARAAHAAIRGKKQPHAYRLRCAVARQKRGRMTTKEIAWQEKLWAEGIATVAQYAVDKYSVDLAVPDVRVAIEVKSGWSAGRLGKGQEEAAKRTALKKLGWVMIDLYGSHWRPGWVDKIKMYIDQRRTLMLN